MSARGHCYVLQARRDLFLRMWPEIGSPSCQLDSLSHVTWPLDLSVVDQSKL